MYIIYIIYTCIYVFPFSVALLVKYDDMTARLNRITAVQIRRIFSQFSN